MKTFSEIKNDVAVLVQRAGDTDYLTKVGVWINLAHDFAYKNYDYWPQLQDIHNFSTVASTGDYFMPLRFDKPMRVFDLTNDKELIPAVEEEYFSSNISAIANSTTTSAPSNYRLYGVSSVTRQISTSGDTIQAKSSSSSDTTQVVRVEGYLDSAMTIVGYTTVSLNGTSAVAGSPVTTFYKITHVSKSADTVGYVTLEDSSGNDLVLLEPTQRVAYHRIMKIGRIPSAVNSMRVLFKRNRQKMVNDYDYPFADIDEYLIQEAYGYALAQEKETMDRADKAWDKSQKALLNILQNVQGNLGPQIQHQMVSGLLQAHRLVK